jgi:hypothetical protein
MAVITGAVKLAIAMVENGSPERVALEVVCQQCRTRDLSLNAQIRAAVKQALGLA